MENPRSVEELGPGDHACLTFTDADERLDIVAAFVRSGLALGHKVLCFTDSVPVDRLPGELSARSIDAEAAIRRGQLAVRGSERIWHVFCLPSGRSGGRPGWCCRGSSGASLAGWKCLPA